MLFTFIFCYGICFAQTAGGTKQENEAKQDNKPKQENKTEKRVKVAPFYTPEQLVQGVRKWSLQIENQHENGAVYLDVSRVSIAKYLYYVQQAQGKRLTEEQIVTRLKILANDANKRSFMWSPVGMSEDRINGTTKDTAFIFDTIMFHIFDPMSMSKKMQNIVDLEKKAKSLYMDANVGKGM
jgi:hypothetical protein